MKRSIYILTTLMFICLLGCLMQAIPSGFKGGMKGSQAGVNHEIVSTVKVVPTAPVTTSYQIHMVSLLTRQNLATALIGIALMVGFVGCIYALIFFVRLLLRLRKQEVFVHKNVVRLRMISGAIIYIVLVMGFLSYSNYISAKEVLQIPGYELKDFSWPVSGLDVGLLLALFAEIFAYGVKLREEQEFTV